MHSSVLLASFQVLNKLIFLVATELDSSNIEHFTLLRKDILESAGSVICV